MSWLTRLFGWPTRSSVVVPSLIQIGYRRNVDMQMEQAHEKVATVYRCVRAKATNAQQIPVAAMRRVGGRGQGRAELLPPTHPLSQLIARPNEEDDFAGILESAVTHLQLRGEAFLEMDMGAMGEGGLRRPVGLYSWPPQWIWKIELDPVRYGYKMFRLLAPRGYEVNIPGENAIFFKFYNPQDPVRGLAPLAAAYQSADTSYASQLFNASFFEHGGVPSLVVQFSSDSGVEQLSATQREELRAELRTLYGGLQNQNSIMVLGPGQEIKSVGSDLKDISFERLLKFNKAEIICAFGLVPILLGDVTDANRANAIEQRRLFWEETMIPEMEDIRSLLNRKLCPAFGKDVFLRFDYSAMPAMRKDLKVLSDAVLPMVMGASGDGSQPILTINEVRTEMLGKPPVPWGDGPLQMDGTPEPDADPTRHFIPPETARALLSEWKNDALMRIKDGASSPLEAFAPGRSAKKATKRLGVEAGQAFQLARAAYVGVAAHWSESSPADGVAEYFEKEIAALPVPQLQ